MTECDEPQDNDNATVHFGNKRPSQKYSGLNSEGALRRHWATQRRTVNLHLHIGGMSPLPEALRQEMAVY